MALGFCCAVALGLVLDLVQVDDANQGVEAARTAIEENYFQAVDDAVLDQASIRGMVQELRRRNDDPFSHYFTPAQYREFSSLTSGTFNGVGLSVNEVRRGLRIADVIADSPAEGADLLEGDVIVAVDGESIVGLPSEVATGRIKGPPGSMVELRIVSAETGKARNVELERAAIRLPAVQGEIQEVDGHKVAYVRLRTFSQGAHGELRDEIERLVREGAEGTVLDLRGNGGGLLNEAILSSSLFVEDGTVVSTRSRTQGDKDYEAVGDALEERPMVVLVNRDSASAAEILTAALSHFDLATVVGTRTYGKGTFQEVIPVPAGGALDLTIGQYLAADGTSLAGTGVHPGVRAEDDPRTEPAPGATFPDARTDEALDEALAVLADELAAAPPQ